MFVGSSTTVGPPHLPFSYPELVGYWLNRWAQSQKLPVHFEVLNAARESIVSTDNVAIVKNEVAPLRPDLVVYYEGGNQFELTRSSTRCRRSRPRPGPAGHRRARLAAGGLALFRHRGPHPRRHRHGRPLAGRPRMAQARLQAAVAGGARRADPDLAYPSLPVNLNLIQRDLDAMRTDWPRSAATSR